MTEKDLKKLSRKELLELLLEQTKRADHLQLQLDQAIQQINNRTLQQTEIGSIAEAALQLNGVFEAAEAAATQYIEAIKTMSGNQAITGDCVFSKQQNTVINTIAEPGEDYHIQESLAKTEYTTITKSIQTTYDQKQILDHIFKDFTVNSNDA